VRRSRMWTATAMLGAVLLTGCGGGDDGGDSADGGGGGGDYCTSLEEAQDSFSGDVDPTSFGEMIDKVDEIVDEAPDEVKGDWEQLQGALQDFESALEDAGLTLEDLSDPSALASVAPEDAAAIQEVATSMSTDFTEATTSIQTHAQEECDLDLGSSGESPSESPAS
jgi:hypothetical protein